MRTQTVPLGGPSPGMTRSLTRYSLGREGDRPKVYVQGGLHAGEMPDPLVLFHLIVLLDSAEAEGRILGHVLVVPPANPIGLSEWLLHKPVGRRDLEGARNFNRGSPDLAKLTGDALGEKLGDDPKANAAIIRAAFATAPDEAKVETEFGALRTRLMQASHDADIVLDLHCDHHALMHFYASTAQPEVTDLLGRCTGSVLALIEDFSGGHALDEAHTAPWRVLRERFVTRAGKFAFLNLQVSEPCDSGMRVSGIFWYRQREFCINECVKRKMSDWFITYALQFGFCPAMTKRQQQQ